MIVRVSHNGSGFVLKRQNFAAFANDIRPLAQENLDPALGAGDLADLLPQWEAHAHARLHALAHGWAQAAEDYEIWLEGQ